MKFLCVAAVAGLLAAGSALNAEKIQPLHLNVYVTSAVLATSAEGFVDGSDKVLVDSVRDLKSALDGKEFHAKKGYPGSLAMYHVVSKPEQADVTLIIAARGINTAQLGARTTAAIYGGVLVANTVPMVGVTRWVSMIISVGTYKKEIIAWSTNRSNLSAGAWGKDAKLLALNAAAWVMANEPKIMDRRAQARFGLLNNH